jgi:thiol:disulfide interchange protein
MKTLALAVLLIVQAVATGKYDPARNADQDIRNAITEAGKTGRRVLIEVGGEWCSWCHIMDKYFDDNPGLAAKRDQYYVLVRVNFSPENENKEVLSRYPKIPGYPHLFVLDTNGRFLHSQGTAELEEGQGYHLGRFTAFLDRWAPPARKK